MNQEKYLQRVEGKGGSDSSGDGILEVGGRRYAVKAFAANLRIILAETC